jgi:tetratricopeptide (TPR) repeat protein
MLVFQPYVNRVNRAAPVSRVAFSPDGRRIAIHTVEDTLEVWDTSSVSDDDVQRREIVSKVGDLFDKLLLRSEVIATLENDPTLENSDREFAIQTARTRSWDYFFVQHRLREAAWRVAQAPGGDKRVYALALRQTQALEHYRPSDSRDSSNLLILGVAHYRLGDWRQAIATLKKAEELAPGGYLAQNAFFLSMAHWQLGDKEQARKWYDQAVPWMEKNQSSNEELRRFRAEAEGLLGIKDEQSHPKDTKSTKGKQ